MKFKRELKKLQKTEIEWGWIDGRAYNRSDINCRGGIPYAMIAIKNEYGGYTKNMKTGSFIYIPPRPYFQQSTSASVSSVIKSSASVYTLLFTGGDYKAKLKMIGNDQVDVLKKTIAKNNLKALHPKTVKIKKSTKQLVDTGALVKNISSKVIYKRAGYE